MNVNQNQEMRQQELEMLQQMQEQDMQEEQEEQLHAQDEPSRPDLRTAVSLTPEELEWAWDIKTAVEENPELNPLADLWYAQLALVDQGDLEASLERVHHFQEFRIQYGVADTYGEAYREAKWMVDEFPGLFLSYSQTNEGSYGLIIDLTKLDMKVLKTGTHVDRFLRSLFYFLNVINPDFSGMRCGVVFLAECEGFGWQHMSLTLYKKIWTDLVLQYPLILCTSKHFHTGVLMNLLASMTRPLLPEGIKSVYRVGCIFDGRLDEIYLQPSREQATHRFLVEIERALGRRYELQALFTLPPKK